MRAGVLGDSPQSTNKTGRRQTRSATMKQWSIPGYCSLVPNCCGLSLRSGTMWIAEACAIIGLGLVVISGVTVDRIHYYFGNEVSFFLSELYYVPIALGLFQLLTSLLLMCGVVLRQRLLFVPWLVYFTLQTVVIFIGCMAVALLLSRKVIPLPYSYTLFLSGVVYAELFRHMILVVLSHCKELRLLSQENISAVV